ncbi:RICIN domain-containing protein [Glycomyces sp. NPDC049804]|uniref:RICIN domain-containing protein n=1 Tax=Glycomyces sp. NPDC049804 TaxID=3154363 RepID=UPI003412AC6A
MWHVGGRHFGRRGSGTAPVGPAGFCAGGVFNARNRLCLDAFGGGTHNGTRLILWTCTGGSNQQWTIRQPIAMNGRSAEPPARRSAR